MKRKLLLPLTLLAFSASISIQAFGQLSGFYQEDFEGAFPPPGWQTVDVLDPANVWEQSYADVYSGSFSAHINYTNNVQGEDWLILPQFTVAATDSISFWLAVDYIAYPPDSTVILVSTTDSNLSSFTTVLATLSDGDNYPDTADVFQYYSFSLSAFAGQNIYVAFRNRNFYGDGVFIDLVTIGTPPTLDAMAVSIDVPDVVSTISSIIPKATIKNNSLSDQSFSVTMTITGGYSSTMIITNLAAGATQQINFDPGTPPEGDNTIFIQTQLVGDALPGNDTLSKVVTAMPPLSGYYQEDFEGTFPPFGWQTVDVLDPLNVWMQSSGNVYSGSNSAYINYNFAGIGEDWLILPQFTVAASDSFSFWLALAFESFPDTTEILVSTTDANLSSFTNVLSVLSDGDNYPETADSFLYYAYSLAGFAGQNIYVAFKNTNNNGDGVYIDLVTIGTAPTLDAMAVSIDVPEVVSTTYSIQPQATVKNNSLTDQSFPVTMTITGGYSSTMNVTNLAPDSIQQITFDPWTPVAGTPTVSVQTQLVGDAIPDNDTISKVVTAQPPLSGFYQEDFEETFPPFGWQTVDVLDPDNVWMQSYVEAYSGANSAYINYTFYVDGEDWLILPQFTVAATDSFSFWLAVNFSGYFPDYTEIMVSTTDANLSSFTTVLATLAEGAGYPETADSFLYYAYSLAGFTGQNIYVAFKNTNSYGDGVFIDLVSIGTPLGTSITENNPVNFDLASYPNPFSQFNFLTFALEEASEVRISIVDVTGREIEELCNKTLPAGPQQIAWNGSGYPAGVYFCKVSVNENVVTQKLVKLK